MAVIHQAFAFDPTAFHRALESCVAPTGELRDDLLLEFAKCGANEARDEAKEYLRLICFDDGWFDTDEGEEPQYDYCYLVALSRYVRSYGPIGNQSFAALELVLPRLGWTSLEARHLLVGQRLKCLAESSGIRAFAASCCSGVRHVSWLSRESVATIASKLAFEAHRFESPGRVMIDALAALPKEFLGSTEPEALLQIAFVEMTQRLNIALKLKAALLLINDANSYQNRPGPDPV